MLLKNLKILRILTILLSISLSAVSIAGGFFPSTYAREVPSMAAQGSGQDLVDLFLVVPLLLVSFLFTARGSRIADKGNGIADKRNRIASLVYAGTLFYVLYSFIIYSLGIHFNRMFLLYCATLGLSTYAFIIVMTDLRDQKPGSWFGKAPVKPVSGFLFFVALVFYLIWLKDLVPAIIHNTIPEDVANYNLLVNPVHVIDLSFALPGLIIGGVLLWRKKDLGYLIASVALVFMIVLTIALAAMVIMLVARGISEDFTVATVFGVLCILCVSFTVLLFRSIKNEKQSI